MGQLFANNAETVLAAALTNVATTLSVTPGTGNEFPSIAALGEDYFLLTLFKITGGVEASHEIVKVTVRAAGTPDTMTIVRAQEGTTALAYLAGDRVELRLTKGTMETLAAGSAVSVVWTIKTTTYTAVSGNNIQANTTGGAFTITLPSTPSAGAIVRIADYAGSFPTNALTIDWNGAKHKGLSDATMTINYLPAGTLDMVYVDSTIGWTF